MAATHRRARSSSPADPEAPTVDTVETGAAAVGAGFGSIWEVSTLRRALMESGSGMFRDCHCTTSGETVADVWTWRFGWRGWLPA